MVIKTLSGALWVTIPVNPAHVKDAIHAGWRSEAWDGATTSARAKR
jgi:hypothetical protein